MPASIPIRHGGIFASRDTILVRATFSRSTISPRASRPTRCSMFLPGSIPTVTIAVPTLRGMACLLVLVALQPCSLVIGRERGRSIPFCDIGQPSHVAVARRDLAPLQGTVPLARAVPRSAESHEPDTAAGLAKTDDRANDRR